jgi:hypothetical protein
MTTNTTQEKTQAIAEAIRKACPELMELKFGCEVKFKPYNSINTFIHEYRDICYLYNDWDRETFTCNKDDLEVIGSPITLSHIFRWLGTLSIIRFTIQDNGCIGELTKVNVYKQGTLEQQSPEFIDFLYSFLS